jgi:glucosylglycerate synthase
MFDIACGIPSYNEEDSISFVAKQLDTGLKEYFPGQKAVIINMDSCSPDLTREAFMNTPTESEKKILMKEGVRGKGNMVEMLLKFIRDNGVKYAVMADADLKSITPDWVYVLLKPILNGCDYCTPLYSRHKYDGTITNLIVYPIVYGLFGYNIRQPIGGDFSFSAKAVKLWLEKPWLESTRYYGVDSFLTTSAICGGLEISQAKLGAKIHKASGPKLGPMFIQVVDTLFTNVYSCMDYISEVKETKTPDTFGSLEELPGAVKLDCGEIRKKAEERIKKYKNLYSRILPAGVSAAAFGIGPEDWCSIVYSFLSNFNSEDREELIDAFSGLYFSRVSSFIEETRDAGVKEAEQAIRKNAKIFFEKRDIFIDSVMAEEI